jgi:hypothetical protein
LGTILPSATVAGEIFRAKMWLRPGEGIFSEQKTANDASLVIFPVDYETDANNQFSSALVQDG